MAWCWMPQQGQRARRWAVRSHVHVHLYIYMYTWRLHSFLLAQAGDAALIRNDVFLKTFVAASIAPDMGIPNLRDFKAHSAEFN